MSRVQHFSSTDLKEPLIVVVRYLMREPEYHDIRAVVEHYVRNFYVPHNNRCKWIEPEKTLEINMGNRTPTKNRRKDRSELVFVRPPLNTFVPYQTTYPFVNVVDIEIAQLYRMCDIQRGVDCRVFVFGTAASDHDDFINGYVQMHRQYPIVTALSFMQELLHTCDNHDDVIPDLLYVHISQGLMNIADRFHYGSYEMDPNAVKAFKDMDQVERIQSFRRRSDVKPFNKTQRDLFAVRSGGQVKFSLAISKTGPDTGTISFSNTKGTINAKKNWKYSVGVQCGIGSLRARSKLPFGIRIKLGIASEDERRGALYHMAHLYMDLKFDPDCKMCLKYKAENDSFERYRAFTYGNYIDY